MRGKVRKFRVYQIIINKSIKGINDPTCDVLSYV